LSNLVVNHPVAKAVQPVGQVLAAQEAEALVLVVFPEELLQAGDQQELR
tara:strand:+ start:407 stop:553 length:147 start_codon:yes stop_codon:yes gene_type:complete